MSILCWFTDVLCQWVQASKLVQPITMQHKFSHFVSISSKTSLFREIQVCSSCYFFQGNLFWCIQASGSPDSCGQRGSGSRKKWSVSPLTIWCLVMRENHPGETEVVYLHKGCLLATPHRQWFCVLSFSESDSEVMCSFSLGWPNMNIKPRDGFTRFGIFRCRYSRNTKCIFIFLLWHNV